MMKLLLILTLVCATCLSNESPDKVEEPLVDNKCVEMAEIPNDKRCKQSYLKWLPSKKGEYENGHVLSTMEDISRNECRKQCWNNSKCALANFNMKDGGETQCSLISDPRGSTPSQDNFVLRFKCCDDFLYSRLRKANKWIIQLMMKANQNQNQSIILQTQFNSYKNQSAFFQNQFKHETQLKLNETQSKLNENQLKLQITIDALEEKINIKLNETQLKLNETQLKLKENQLKLQGTIDDLKSLKMEYRSAQNNFTKQVLAITNGVRLLSLNKPTWQSSNGGAESSRAVDGKYDTISHTKEDNPSWLMVDLTAIFDITRVSYKQHHPQGSIYNYNLIISTSLDQKEWKIVSSSTTGSPIREIARFVRVTTPPGAKRYLVLDELEVYGRDHVE